MQNPHDLIIIGGGIAGLIHLHYANLAGLDAQLVEKSAGVGGLWRELPPWQDIQIRESDWTVGDMPIEGPLQPQILANIESWVARFGLAPRIHLGRAVTRAKQMDGIWQVETPQGTLHARHLVAATGGHNTPLIPQVQRTGATLPELHSSALRDPALLRGKAVIVVGGGASALDLLDQSFLNGAARVVWVHRHTRWFTPTHKPKTVAGSVRPFGQLQASGMPIDRQNEMINADLRARYAKFGIEAIMPTQAMDLRSDQLFPGRAVMLQNFARIERHVGEVTAIEGNTAVLDSGERLQADLLLWGTGYATHLGYFDNPRIAAIRSVRELAARCVCLMRSIDEPNLFFPGVGLDGAGTTQMNIAVMARTVMSHIRGRARLDMEPTPHRLNHLDMVRHLAERDPESFAAEGGWQHYRDLSLKLDADQPFPMP
jgi:lysine/ornithine N-monooxygenase